MTCSSPGSTPHLILTRPAGTAGALARRVRRHGAVPLLLPVFRLLQAADPPAALRALENALAADVLLFTSPAAVRFAAGLAPLRPSATTRVIAVGAATVAALHRHGLPEVLAPARQDSEGVLALPLLQQPRGWQVAVVGGGAGRGLIQARLRERGAQILEAAVYQRLPARLDRRHFLPILQAEGPLFLLLSSAQAIRVLVERLPEPVLQRLRQATVVASSERLAGAVRDAGFGPIVRAKSAQGEDLLAAALAAMAI